MSDNLSTLSGIELDDIARAARRQFESFGGGDLGWREAVRSILDRDAPAKELDITARVSLSGFFHVKLGADGGHVVFSTKTNYGKKAKVKETTIFLDVWESLSDLDFAYGVVQLEVDDHVKTTDFDDNTTFTITV
jgi:hypothetical protein